MHEVNQPLEPCPACTFCAPCAAVGWMHKLDPDQSGTITTDQFTDAIAVTGEEGDVVAVIEQHGGKMTCDVAASTDQKK